jgi:hypothetical protein
MPVSTLTWTTISRPIVWAASASCAPTSASKIEQVIARRAIASALSGSV